LRRFSSILRGNQAAATLARKDPPRAAQYLPRSWAGSSRSSGKFAVLVFFLRWPTGQEGQLPGCAGSASGRGGWPSWPVGQVAANGPAVAVGGGRWQCLACAGDLANHWANHLATATSWAAPGRRSARRLPAGTEVNGWRRRARPGSPWPRLLRARLPATVLCVRACGYRPCGNCMRKRYREWAKGGVPGSAGYPWRVLPKGGPGERRS
jgi:hypothetical protein